jgi:hypothetical protein
MYCAAGWEKMIASNGHRVDLEEQPYRWSQGWYDDPPVGTEVLLGDGLVDVYVGRGVWQTVAVRRVIAWRAACRNCLLAGCQPDAWDNCSVSATRCPSSHSWAAYRSCVSY